MGDAALRDTERSAGGSASMGDKHPPSLRYLALLANKNSVIFKNL